MGFPQECHHAGLILFVIAADRTPFGKQHLGFWPLVLWWRSQVFFSVFSFWRRIFVHVYVYAVEGTLQNPHRTNSYTITIKRHNVPQTFSRQLCTCTGGVCGAAEFGISPRPSKYRAGIAHTNTDTNALHSKWDPYVLSCRRKQRAMTDEVNASSRW